MTKGKILMIGEKESYLVRILIKKTLDAGAECGFAHWDIDSINAVWEGTGLVTLYLEENFRPKESVLHFLADRMADGGQQMILIGARTEVSFVSSHVPEELIYKTFIRPLNNDEYVSSIEEIRRIEEMGGFKKSILIVDDDPGYMSLVREWLKGTYKVAMANSGMQALRWLGRNKADLILLDHEMPVTSGPQVLEMLRSDPETRSIPVMFLTGKGDKESVMAVLALKPEGYFLKTIGKVELLEKLGEFFLKE